MKDLGGGVGKLKDMGGGGGKLKDLIRGGGQLIKGGGGQLKGPIGSEDSGCSNLGFFVMGSVLLSSSMSL